MAMNKYSFPIGQLEDAHLKWVNEQAHKKAMSSPAFFSALADACTREQRRRVEKPDDEPVVFEIPIILEKKKHYQNACAWAVFSMQAAHEQGAVVLRNFCGVCMEILYWQLDEAILDHAMQRENVNRVKH